MTDPAVVSAWVEASCASQGLPVRVADLGILAQVAGLLGAAPGASRVARPAGRRRGSGSPDGCEPVGVEAVVAASGGCDDEVVEDGGHDCVLPGQRQGLPALP